MLLGNKAVSLDSLPAGPGRLLWGRRKGLAWLGYWGVTLSRLCLIPLFLSVKLEHCLQRGAVLTCTVV